MLIRVRSKAGTWRVPDLTGTSTVGDIKAWIASEHAIAVDRQVISADVKQANVLSDTATLRSLQVGHGDMLYLEFDGEAISTTGGGGIVQRKINADGTLTHATYDSRLEKTGFRPGMKALRDMKMHWTLSEFMLMDAQFEFKIKAQKKPYIEKVMLDGASCNSFQAYLRQFAFQQSRCGWLYGTVQPPTSTEEEALPTVVVECIYEPPQTGDPYGFEVHDDPHADKVDAVAAALGWTKVGWIFSHPPREDETFHFSSREILLAAQLQLDAGGPKTPFVTVKVTLDKEGQASFEAFQVSDQCLDMFSAGALLEDETNPTACAVHETFTAMVEMKAAKEVDNNFFLTVVPVANHTSTLAADFPPLHREGNLRTRQTLKNQLRKASGPYIDRLKDFQLLVFLADYLDVQTDIPVICQSILSPDVPLDSGYPVLIDSVAGH
ncbi:NPL4-like protein [Achlya hypogyna]|uniref:NPL4-like protein n=1 Tax=Achlya hypogyna TaxID=1202772 RepID=A0A1V9YMJ2_ACHHY|nr:NPL4-like protein [Achlya hypogyna]